MFRNIIFVLMYHRHKLLDIIYLNIQFFALWQTLPFYENLNIVHDYIFEVAWSTDNPVVKYGSVTRKWDNTDKEAIKTVEVRTSENTLKNIRRDRREVQVSF
jgi:hypothetical protein